MPVSRSACCAVIALFWAGGITAAPLSAADHFLVLAGGFTPASNPASLEKNVLFLQRIVAAAYADRPSLDVFFADGRPDKPTLQVKDPRAIPRANQLMAEFFGSERNLGLTYRPHGIPDVVGGTSVESVSRWFAAAERRIRPGDRLIVYVSSHGAPSQSKDQPYETSIYFWNRRKLLVSELDSLLNRLHEDVRITTVMVQCHAGGFARLAFQDARPEAGASRQLRCGFFATTHSRPAAGCTPEVNEADYEEYSSYFWAAMTGARRTGEAIELPDYNGDGRVTMDEAHAYSILVSDTIDLPIKTSGEYLRHASRFGESPAGDSLLPRDPPYEAVLELAGPVERAVLEGLSEQLNLRNADRIQTARREGGRRDSPSRSRFRPGGDARARRSQADTLKERIADTVRRRWPELANVLNPRSLELLLQKPEEFVQAIETHPDYARYRELTESQERTLNDTQRRVKYERFVRVAENVILAENLRRGGNEAEQQQYLRLVQAEGEGWGP